MSLPRNTLRGTGENLHCESTISVNKFRELAHIFFVFEMIRTSRGRNTMAKATARKAVKKAPAKKARAAAKKPAARTAAKKTVKKAAPRAAAKKKKAA